MSRSQKIADRLMIAGMCLCTIGALLEVILSVDTLLFCIGVSKVICGVIGIVVSCSVVWNMAKFEELDKAASAEPDE